MWGFPQTALQVTLLRDLRTLVPVTRAPKNGPVERLSQTQLRQKAIKEAGQRNLCLREIILHREFARNQDPRIEKNDSKGHTWSMTSDSDLPSDVSVENARHPGCWLIPITVEGVQTLALLDTGASVLMMGRPLYQKVQQVSRLRLQTQDTP